MAAVLSSEQRPVFVFLLGAMRTTNILALSRTPVSPWGRGGGDFSEERRPGSAPLPWHHHRSPESPIQVPLSRGVFQTGENPTESPGAAGAFVCGVGVGCLRAVTMAVTVMVALALGGSPPFICAWGRGAGI